MLPDPIDLISRKTGNWWTDDRRNWCAYCGVKLSYGSCSVEPSSATRDHISPKPFRKTGSQPKSPHITIPACRCCNQKRGARHLAEFFGSARFRKVRANGKPEKAWSLRDLWLVAALAAVYQAYELSDERPCSSRQRSAG